MADEQRERDAAEEATGGSPRYAPHDNGQQGPDNGESVVADDDLAMRGAGPAGESAGSGVPGLGGSPGGTPNSGGVGLPGGNRRLGAGRAKTSDASLGSTPATGGLGTGGNARSGHGQTPSSDVLPGGATRSTTNDIPTHGDEAATHLRGGHGARKAPVPPGPDTPVSDAPQYDADNTRAQSVASHPTPDNPIPEQPAPGLMDRPGPEAEI